MSFADKFHSEIPASGDLRIETDSLGSLKIPKNALWGIHSERSFRNFKISGEKPPEELIRAYATVKKAVLKVNTELGYIKNTKQIPGKTKAIFQACDEMEAGELSHYVIIDALSGGAGTSFNMNINEVLSNRALVIGGFNPGRYDLISPFDDLNLHQSTNDTFPTTVKLAAIQQLRILEEEVTALQEAFQKKEKETAHIVKISRTEMMDAVLTTAGRQMSAYADAIARDRWRIYKCEERLRVINLGGTAIGSSLGAPRKYIFKAASTLKEITGIGFSRAENLIDNTQNTDVFAEVSGILKALAVTLNKISNDLRLLSAGPECGIAEINLPPVQTGSSIMPGKINPVIPEAVSQSALAVMGFDQTLTTAAATGNLELNHNLPLIAHTLFKIIRYLTESVKILRTGCICDLTFNKEKCKEHVERSYGTAAALVHQLGYHTVEEILKTAKLKNITVKEAAILLKKISAEDFDHFITPAAVLKTGF